MDNQEQLINDIAENIKTGQVQPWKAESVLLEEYGIVSPEHFRVAALARRKVIEHLTGQEFRHLELPDRPYLMKWRCPNDNAEWHLAAGLPVIDGRLSSGGVAITLNGEDPLRLKHAAQDRTTAE